MEKLSREERAEAVRRLQAYFRDEREEDLGDLAAGLLLDFVEAEIAPAYYNRGVRDARTTTTNALASLVDELEVLEIPTATPARRRPPPGE